MAGSLLFHLAEQKRHPRLSVTHYSDLERGNNFFSNRCRGHAELPVRAEAIRYRILITALWKEAIAVCITRVKRHAPGRRRSRSNSPVPAKSNAPVAGSGIGVAGGSVRINAFNWLP